MSGPDDLDRDLSGLSVGRVTRLCTHIRDAGTPDGLLLKGAPAKLRQVRLLRPFCRRANLHTLTYLSLIHI